MKTLERPPIIPWDDKWKDNGITIAPRDLQTWSTAFSQGSFPGATTVFSGTFDIIPIRNMNVKSIMCQAERITAIGNIFTFIAAQVSILVANPIDNFFTWNLQPQRNSINATPFDWNLLFSPSADKRRMDVVMNEGVTYTFTVSAFDQFAVNDQANIYFTIEYEQ